MDEAKLLERMTVAALLRAAGLPQPPERVDAEKLLGLLKEETVEITIRVQRRGWSDTLTIRCIPAQGDTSLAEKLGLTLNINGKQCIIIPPWLKQDPLD